MLKSAITEPLQEHHVVVSKIPKPKPPLHHESQKINLEQLLFEEFPQVEQKNIENKIPQVVFKELETEIDHVTNRMVSVSNTHDERLLLKQKRLNEIDQQLDSIEHYIINLVSWAPGYNSGIDGMRNSLLTSKSRLEQEKHTEQLKCLDDCSHIQQSLLDLIREYERLKSDIDLLAQGREGAP